RIVSVVGARPNFMKLAPVDRALVQRPGVEHVIVHTGQHYDPDMSDAFFEELWIPAPDHHLGVGCGSHAAQTAAVMERLEPVLGLAGGAQAQRPCTTRAAGGSVRGGHPPSAIQRR